MIRIAAYIVVCVLCLKNHLLQAQSINGPLYRNQGLMQSQIQNCSIPNPSMPNVISLGMCPYQTFIMPMNVGTPPQPLFFIVDTGQVFVEVLTNQTNQAGFAITESNTTEMSGEWISIEFGNGFSAPAQLGNDFVNFNNSSINTRSDMFIVTQSVPNNYSDVISGVVGLGLSDLYDNIFQLAYNSGQISTAMFTLSLNTFNQSYLYYNQLPSEIIDSSIFIRSHSDEQFQLLIIGLFVGATQYTSGAPSYAVISSGNNYFYLNNKIYTAVVNHFFSNCTQTSSGPSCNCNDVSSWPTFSIMFAGAQVYIPAESYYFNLSDGSCSYGFGYIQDEKDFMILGSSFFVNYNLTFDSVDERIGMQGNLTPIQVINFEYFIIWQYLSFVLAVGLAIFAGVIGWHIKVIQKDRPTSIIEFSISDRFIETD